MLQQNVYSKRQRNVLMQFVRREVAKMTKHCIVVEMQTRLLKIHIMSSVVGGNKKIQLKEKNTQQPEYDGN